MMLTTQRAFYITYAFLSIGLVFRIIGVSTDHWVTTMIDIEDVHVDEWAGLFRECAHAIYLTQDTTCNDLDSTQGDYVLGCQIMACTATVWLALCLSFVLFSHWLTAVKQTPGKAVVVIACTGVLANVCNITAIAAGIWFLRQRSETVSWSAVLYFVSELFNFSSVWCMYYLRRCLRQ